MERQTQEQKHHHHRERYAGPDSDLVEKKIGEVAVDSAEAEEDILDEIDRVLEANAAEFVNNYIQKGGE